MMTGSGEEIVVGEGEPMEIEMEESSKPSVMISVSEEEIDFGEGEAMEIEMKESSNNTSWILPLCISHAAAAWGERSWEFGAGLLLLYLDKDDLRLTALLVLVACTACVLLGSRIGTLVDGSTLKQGAIVTLAIQNFGIVAAATFAVGAFYYQGMAALSILFSVVARLGSLGSTISTEKQWASALSQTSNSTIITGPVVTTTKKFTYNQLDSKVDEENAAVKDGIASPVDQKSDCVSQKVSPSKKFKYDALGSDENEGGTRTEEKRKANDVCFPLVQEELNYDSETKFYKAGSLILSQVNARMRCIDLFCNLMAPMAVGFLLEYATPTIAALTIAAFNLLAWPIEVACLLWIHARYHDVLVSYNDENVSMQEQNTAEAVDDDEHEERFSAWKTYRRQPIVRSAFALAILYLTVVSFGTIMTAWLVSLGFSESYVAIARAMAAASGMAATRVAPFATSEYGMEGAAARFIWWLWICILPCAVVAPFAREEPELLWVVVVAVIVSRFGLWGFDLCVTQMLQECIVPKDKMGSVNGTQAALQNAFDALAAMSCVLLPDPKKFAFLILGSFGAVTVAALLQTSTLFKQERSTRTPCCCHG